RRGGAPDANLRTSPGRLVLKQPLSKYWEHIRSSFWFVPSLMAVGAMALAFAMVTLDQIAGASWLAKAGWVDTGGAEGASAVLQTIAGSMITIAGVVFSLTLVALSIASSQFGPRLLYNFMRDRTNQVVLGTFIATFLYCLLVLRTIRYAPEDGFVPHLSVTLGVVFALASLWVLIYFIHHVSVSVQADHIIARVGRDLLRGVKNIFPAQIGRDPPDRASDDAAALPKNFESDARAVAAEGDGYLQLIDVDALMELATERDVVLRLEYRPGHYVVDGSTLALAWPADRVDDSVAEELNAAFGIGPQRTPNQDIEHAVLQLVEIAVRALSPGINDPFTAMACIDRLASGLSRIARTKMPSPYRCDEEGRLRVVAPPASFEGIVDAALNQIRQNARANAAVSIRLLEAISAIATMTDDAEQPAVLRRHADVIARGARDAIPEQEDRRAVAERHTDVVAALSASPPQRPEQARYADA
ncbi:MAG TPA: DUF2254 domain-containing protein, partial [Steroidobacteraceae bacterium]|nr:DUF2254 domain-containing protein [Steroidobacteraceae bacterium]